MDPPVKQPKFDPSLLEGTWWSQTFNPNGEYAEYNATQQLSDLPGPVVLALQTSLPQRDGLGEEAVNWNVTCISKDGRTVLRRCGLQKGGPRSGRNCGEDDLWATQKEGSSKKRNVPLANGSSAFGYREVIYLIDAGLCPCRRCARALLALAKRTDSTIVVRPMTDYELISKNRTALEGDYVLVYAPDAETFIVYYTRDEEAPANAGDRDVTGDPVRSWFECGVISCRRSYTVRFASQQRKNSLVKIKRGSINSEEYPSIHCPRCGVSLLLVQRARGGFPADEIAHNG